MICWRCHEGVGGPVCVGCGAVQPLPPDLDLFEVLGLPRRFHLERDVIEEAVRARAREVHPDRHVFASSVEKRMALQWAARVNEARRVLLDPLKRAEWLARGRIAQDDATSPSDPGFLERIFQLRMAAMEGNPAVAGEANRMRESLMEKLDALFTAWENGRGDLAAVPEVLTQLRYVNNVLRECA